MSEFEGHTPGPWKPHFEEAYFVTGPDLGRVAMMMNLKGAHGLGGRRSGKESAANARLIAAAPDLLAERDRLRAEVEALRADAERYRFCRANRLWLRAQQMPLLMSEWEQMIDAARAALKENEG